MIVAHRGASFDAPENTIPAFELAWEQGADAIEGDFRLTADGRIVCIHNSDTRAMAGERLIVSSSTLAELSALDCGIRRGAKWRGTRIATLADVFQTVPPGKQIFIEVKCGAEILEELIREISISGLTDSQITVISYNSDVISALKKARSGIKAMWIVDIKTSLMGRLKPTTDEMIRQLRSLGANGVSARACRRIGRAHVQEVLATGLEYHVWTLDSPRRAARFLTLGVHSITTNRPGYIRKKLGL